MDICLASLRHMKGTPWNVYCIRSHLVLIPEWSNCVYRVLITLHEFRSQPSTKTVILGVATLNAESHSDMGPGIEMTL